MSSTLRYWLVVVATSVVVAVAVNGALFGVMLWAEERRFAAEWERTKREGAIMMEATKAADECNRKLLEERLPRSGAP